jgi:transposase
MNNSTIEYVGVDYHTKFALATRMTQDGKVISQDKVENTKEDIRAYMAELPQGSQVAVEATNNWYAFCEFCHGLPIEITLVNPLETKLIARRRIKTDSLDSKTLADLLRTNFVSESYLAPQAVRDVRELVRYRTVLVRLRTQFKTRIRSVLFKTGNRIKADDVASKGGREQLGELQMRSIYQQEIASCLVVIDDLDKQIDQFSTQIRQQAEITKEAQLLMSIPGVGFYSALLITSELGDYRRFNASRKLCAWAGIVPSVQSSGGKTHRGHITKQGNAYVRYVLLQAVPHVIKKSSSLGRLYQRVLKKHGRRVAKVAVARKLLAIMLSMLKTDQPFKAC